MGEKSGSLFNMLVVAAVTVLIIAGLKLAMPAIQGNVTGGMADMVKSEFSVNEGETPAE
ncbi:hypothetical protein [Ornithinibacillus contaminans]|uniref:hypothetical protein n=1 Tax=Ornithinibacillus contaminans TaxID=694055 RepID=UPI0012EDBA63|nr:hypothetical protein [Ornithinibacillus contaminans]